MAEKQSRPGDKNLIPINQRPVEEQRQMRLNAGKESGAGEKSSYAS